MRRFAQRGASMLLILLIMVLLLVAFFATYTLSRVSAGGDERAETQKRLATAAAALDRFAAANQRLPCPADPAAATGAEVTATAATCSFDTGTIPWLTLGLTSDAGLDAWGRKLSYRVYTGNRGSFTQPGGVSMVECDTVEPTPQTGATGVAASLGGLCVPNTDPYQRTTTPEKFLFGKGLTVSDFGTTHNDVAYVLLSHGASGLGAYTTAGNQLAMPASIDEKNNAGDPTKTFTAKAFSGADIEVIHATHFDDLIVYATIGDLVKRIGLEARDWPDTSTSSMTFDAATVAAAAGVGSVTPGDLGTPTLDFGSARVTGYVGTSSPTPTGTETNLTYDTSGSGGGGVGVAGALSNRISSFGGEFIRVELAQAATSFAVTLDDFGTYSLLGQTYTERVQITFYLDTVAVGTAQTKQACNADGGLASFEVTPGGTFNKVDIAPLAASGSGGGSWVSAFLLSAIKACATSSPPCKTSLATGANTCP